MAKAIEIKSKGVMCDNPACDFLDPNMDMPSGVEGLRAFIGTPCPKCGASLLTKEDFDSMVFMFGLAQIVNDTIGSLPEDALPESERMTIPVIMDGTGSVVINLSGATKHE